MKVAKGPAKSRVRGGTRKQEQSCLPRRRRCQPGGWHDALPDCHRQVAAAQRLRGAECQAGGRAAAAQPAHQLAQDTEANTSSSRRPRPAVLVMPMGLQNRASRGRMSAPGRLVGGSWSCPCWTGQHYSSAQGLLHLRAGGQASHAALKEEGVCSSTHCVAAHEPPGHAAPSAAGPQARLPAQLARGKAVEVAAGWLQPTHVDGDCPVVRLIGDACAAAWRDAQLQPVSCQQRASDTPLIQKETDSSTAAAAVTLPCVYIESLEQPLLQE